MRLFKCNLNRRLSAPTSGSARRRARERRRAEQTRAEGETLARERREQRLKEKIEQQTQARIELASFEPWGRAGGGAPNPRGIRFSDLRSVGIYPENELKGFAAHEASRRWSPRQLHTTRLREDPLICYADLLRKTVDNEIRYKQTPQQKEKYKKILDEMVYNRKKAIDEEIRHDLEYERKMHNIEEPWGKPGPGGLTWRNPKDIGLNFSKSMGWTDNDIFNTMSGIQKTNKGSSLTLPKVKTVDDDTKNKANKDNIKKSYVDKLPKIIKSSSANNTLKENRKSSNENNGFVCHRSGNTKKLPKKNKYVKRLSNGTVKRVFEEKVNNGDNGETVEKKLTPEAAILRLTGGIELVPLLARRRRVGARTLPSSDVTRPPEQSCQWRETLDMEHLKDLKHQMRVKCEKQEESRRDSAESVRRHHVTWASLWGRPGHGAPQQRGRYARSDLAQLLYLPSFMNANST